MSDEKATSTPGWATTALVIMAALAGYGLVEILIDLWKWIQ